MKKGKIRVNIEISPEMMQLLRTLSESLDLNMTETIKLGIQLQSTLLQERKKGFKILLSSNKETKELVFPTFY